MTFEETFAPKLQNSPRWESFQYIVNELANLNRPVVIVETGTARIKDNWMGDGQSTLIWDWVLETLGGEGYSVDNSLGAITTVKTQVKFILPVWSNSKTFLLKFPYQKDIDLLFLDSYDYDRTNKEVCALSELHHICELSLVYEHLKSGCIIAIDDCHSNTSGKHYLVQEFFKRLGVEPVKTGYITIWKKP